MALTNLQAKAAKLAAEKNTQKSNQTPKKKAEKSPETAGPPTTKKQSRSEPAPGGKPPPPTPPIPVKVSVFYCPLQSSFYAKNDQGEFQVFGRSELKSLLKQNRFSPFFLHPDGLNFMESELLRIVKSQNVRYAGTLSGYEPGLYEMYTQRFLVTSGPRFIVPKAGTWKNLKTLITGLLGNQAKYFFAWIKCANASLRRGPPWASGQLLGIAGPPRCGKSVLQDLITPMLGGRVSSPYDYMIGESNFNADIYGAEHGLIGDTNHATDHKSRREFGAAIKKLVVERVHKLHDKGKTGISCTPFVRLTLTLNENPEALLVLPSLDTDVKDKIILLHGKEWGIKEQAAKFPGWNAYEAQLRSELPALLYAMNKWTIPEEISGGDYGVESFHADTLVDALTSMSQDQSLLNIIDSYIFDKRLCERWEGTATDLVKDLVKAVGNSGGAISIPPEWRAGQLLTLLADKHPARIKKFGAGKNQVRYEILGPT